MGLSENAKYFVGEESNQHGIDKTITLRKKK